MMEKGESMKVMEFLAAQCSKCGTKKMVNEKGKFTIEGRKCEGTSNYCPSCKTFNIPNSWIVCYNSVNGLRYSSVGKISEAIVEVGHVSGSQEEKHDFYFKGKFLGRFESRCGYDRQVKRQNIVNKFVETLKKERS
jgi:hypothetical protein